MLLGICGILLDTYSVSASCDPIAAHPALREPSLAMMLSALLIGGDDAPMVPVGKGASAGVTHAGI